jgi:hypothetical protein
MIMVHRLKKYLEKNISVNVLNSMEFKNRRTFFSILTSQNCVVVLMNRIIMNMDILIPPGGVKSACSGDTY